MADADYIKENEEDEEVEASLYEPLINQIEARIADQPELTELEIDYQYTPNGKGIKPYLTISFDALYSILMHEVRKDSYVDQDDVPGLMLALGLYATAAGHSNESALSDWRQMAEDTRDSSEEEEEENDVAE